jgi:hypothetical protein
MKLSRDEALHNAQLLMEYSESAIDCIKVRILTEYGNIDMDDTERFNIVNQLFRDVERQSLPVVCKLLEAVSLEHIKYIVGTI